jgi:phospholipase C
LADVGHWYDFEITSQSDPYYYRRFAGRVETGEDSFSDPSMM